MFQKNASIAQHRADFLEIVKNHELKILHDSGIYRHVSFAKPGTNDYSFSLVTWPGYLSISGDCGSYTFSRIPDMFDFFGRNINQIDLRYWEEKIESSDKNGEIKKWDQGLYQDQIIECLKSRFDVSDESLFDELEEEDLDEKEGDDSEDVPTSDLKKCLAKVKEEGIWDAENGWIASERMTGFEYEGDYIFPDFWEYDCHEYTHRYIFCCLAIAWGINKYFEEKEKSNKYRRERYWNLQRIRGKNQRSSLESSERSKSRRKRLK